ncbi:GTP cyclohydrolase FolE2 [Mycobacterium bohemicum DSM 44277]|uniref:GTP cyclohydrolase n=2 Tax=Mycobacterium bohemicum TaxID=56425 RepID=A0A1X1QWX8_MYCBE|nr:GTP cyclohydrolase FolE2 [Mycobacterium bohemicum]MCV6970071.1 GTP cyclohydrolase I FolE2 [Mycobacterium bohemicum]ORU95801.1 GTP cyclohydrolase [Mycobacterium bohemicum]CPR10453.1 GTP cyclohydrolase FolE2 [Mycobacterium bohemicum DSM 44277]
MTQLLDIQNQSDDRGIPIDEVGISGLRYPVVFDDGELSQAVVADLEITVRLPADRRGTHMSRMVQAADAHMQVIDPREFASVWKILADILDASSARVSAVLPVAMRVAAPTSGEEAWQVHDVRLRGDLSDDLFTLETTVLADVTTLCPCSKAISDYGAHNQRSRVSLTVQGRGDAAYPVAVSTLIEMIRANSSCPVFPVVKRSDERVITMAAYDKPMFVEDLVRQLSLACRAQVVGHSVEIRTLESIHSHDAVARLSWSPM